MNEHTAKIANDIPVLAQETADYITKIRQDLNDLEFALRVLARDPKNWDGHQAMIDAYNDVVEKIAAYGRIAYVISNGHMHLDNNR